MLGKGWRVEVIVEILRLLKDKMDIKMGWEEG